MVYAFVKKTVDLNSCDPTLKKSGIFDSQWYSLNLHLIEIKNKSFNNLNYLSYLINFKATFNLSYSEFTYRVSYET